METNYLPDILFKTPESNFYIKDSKTIPDDFNISCNIYKGIHLSKEIGELYDKFDGWTEATLKDIKELKSLIPPVYLYFITLESFEIEVMNGGIDQFITNSSGGLTVFLKEAGKFYNLHYMSKVYEKILEVYTIEEILSWEKRNSKSEDIYNNPTKLNKQYEDTIEYTYQYVHSIWDKSKNNLISNTLRKYVTNNKKIFMLE